MVHPHDEDCIILIHCVILLSGILSAILFLIISSLKVVQSLYVEFFIFVFRVFFLLKACCWVVSPHEFWREVAPQSEHCLWWMLFIFFKNLVYSKDNFSLVVSSLNFKFQFKYQVHLYCIHFFYKNPEWKAAHSFTGNNTFAKATGAFAIFMPITPHPKGYVLHRSFFLGQSHFPEVW